MPNLPAKWKQPSKWKAAAKLALAAANKESDSAADKMGAVGLQVVARRMSGISKGQHALLNTADVSNRDSNGFPVDLEPDVLGKGANNTARTFLEKSRKVSLFRKGNLYYRLLAMGWPTLMFTFIMSYVIAIGTLMFMMLAFHNDIEAENYSKYFKALWLTAGNIITCGFHGYIMATTPTLSAMCSVQQFIGLILNCIMTAMIFTKFQQPVSDMIFSQNILVTKRDGKTALMLRLGNFRCNRIYTPDIRFSMMLPRRTLEGDTLIETTALAVSVPSFITSSCSVVHMIDDDSTIGGGRLTYESLMPGGEFSGIAFTIVFVGMDGTTASDITGFARYTADDLLFGDFKGGTALGFQNIMLPKNGNMTCDFTKFNHLLKTKTGATLTPNPGSGAGGEQWGESKAQQDWNNLFCELCM